MQPDSTTVLAPVGTFSPEATTTSLEVHRQAPAGYTEYYNTRYRFSLFYPDDLQANEHDEGGGASTITFQNPDTAHGFQIFIAPYAKAQVSEERFKQDEPSGVRKGLQNVAIDGATGASFYSKDPALGETAELWFVHGGYLFEVTTLKPLGSWLGGIMQSWKFL
ncbi:MAG: hypothetical protein HY220_01225 [Candidatus Sungbacteria bacterium]|uniref:Uncharacterized protein n=1 Tax=Candidatus Sungiibacteriota bacterium TaxID=2750080 RepID=A0A9D6LPH2_9BACT|nr:hypothetical protein [Candidatus Sungbacteria bacterium]